MTQPTIAGVKERIRRETEQMKKEALKALFDKGYGPILEQASEHYHHAGMGLRPKADVCLVKAIAGVPLTAEEIINAYDEYIDGEISLRPARKVPLRPTGTGTGKEGQEEGG